MLDDGTSASTAHKLRLLFIFLNVNAQKQIDAHAVCSVRRTAETRCVLCRPPYTLRLHGLFTAPKS